jgi:hypothetical protein
MSEELGSIGLRSRTCPRCGGPMEPEYIVGEPDKLHWVAPKMKENRPDYSPWQEQFPLYPTGRSWRDMTRHLPLSYRCAKCWIYWLGPDQQDLSSGTAPSP